MSANRERVDLLAEQVEQALGLPEGSVWWNPAHRGQPASVVIPVDVIADYLDALPVSDSP